MAATVRPAQPEDAEAMARVHTRSWSDAYEGLLPQDLIVGQTVEGRVEQWQRTIASDRMRSWAAEAGDEIIGVCSIGPSRDDPEVGVVYTIYVVGEHWGTGAGSSLWEAAMQGLRDMGFASARLWVLDTNERARRFYEHKGWRHDGATKLDDAFGEPISEVRYVRP